MTGVAGTRRKIGPNLDNSPRDSTAGGANDRWATSRRCCATSGEAPNMPRTSVMPTAYKRSSPTNATVSVPPTPFASLPRRRSVYLGGEPEKERRTRRGPRERRT